MRSSPRRWIILIFGWAGRFFATLGYPNQESGVVKLTRDEQRHFVRSNPEIFQPVKGAWGRRGGTSVHLPAAKIDVVHEAVAAASRRSDL